MSRMQCVETQSEKCRQVSLETKINRQYSVGTRTCEPSSIDLRRQTHQEGGAELAPLGRPQLVLQPLRVRLHHIRKRLATLALHWREGRTCERQKCVRAYTELDEKRTAHVRLRSAKEGTQGSTSSAELETWYARLPGGIER